LTTSKLRRLTNDPYADLQPAWSPDGKRIAFATDRYSSDLTKLEIGQYRLALIDAESGAIEQVRAFTNGKNINPQWSADGRSLFFVSDRDGIPNLYRVGVESGEVAQLTRVATGLSGITASSPTMSIASKTNIAAFSVYEGGKYDIYVTSEPVGSTKGLVAAEDLSGSPDANAGELPPLNRRPSQVATLLSDASFGLPPATAPATYDVKDYSPKLQLEGLAQPTIAVGASRFGAAVGGGIALQFGDMLGDHILATAVQLNSGVTNNFSFKDTAAQALYYNQKNRWNWGIVGGQIPYLSGAFQSSVGNAGRTTRRDRRGADLPADRAERRRPGCVSPRSLAARRVPGRRHANLFRSDRRDVGLLVAHRRVARRRQQRDIVGGSADAVVGLGRVRLRHVELRRHQPGAGPAVSFRGDADVWFHPVLEPARRLPPLLHARLVLHLRRARHALRAVRVRRRRHTALPALHRLSESRARLRRRHVRGA
jgi:dipeptidyl aminopeptidase/acylaminoacyl peptidase